MPTEQVRTSLHTVELNNRDTFNIPPLHEEGEGEALDLPKRLQAQGLKRMDTEIGILGLILAQLQSTHRTIENIERNTANYGGLSFTSALAAGPSFGTPPLVDGALKVYVVNINDLTTGRGPGGILEGLLGGIGRFFGGIFGGLFGGTISGVALPVLLLQIAKIVYSLSVQMAKIADTVERIINAVERIINRLGISGASFQKGPEKGKGGEKTGTAGGGSMSIDLIRALTRLFQTASGGPEVAGKGASSARTEGDQQWMSILKAVSGILTNMKSIIDGLIIVLPLLIGTLASLIGHFNAIKITILDLLQFMLYNIFLLRGVILVTVYDTIASVAQLAASIFKTVGTVVTEISTAIFKLVAELVMAALEVIRFFGTGLQQTVEKLMQWLVGPLSEVLTFLGDLRVFRVIVHIIQTIPSIIPALHELIYGKPLPQKEAEALQKAAQLSIPGPSTGVGLSSIYIPSTLNLAESLGKVSDFLVLQTQEQGRMGTALREMNKSFGKAQRGLEDIGKALNDETKKGEKGFTNVVEDRSKKLQAAMLTEPLLKTSKEVARRPETGLERIATEYENWLKGGGLTMVLGNITEYFRRTPITGPEAAKSLPGQIVTKTAEQEIRATVEIGEVIIEVEPSPVEPSSSTGPISQSFVEELLLRIQELQYERQMRGSRLGQGSPIAFS